MWPGKAALLIYGIARERYTPDDFRELNQLLELEDLKVRDPEAAQEMLNRQGMD